MSGRRFLISAKDIVHSENILKIQTLVKEGFDIDSSLKVTVNHQEGISTLLSEVKDKVRNVESLCLDERSREVSDNVAGYVVHKAKSLLGDCCISGLKGETGSSAEKYIGVLSRGGLVTPSESLGEIVAQSFAVLDACSQTIKTSQLPSRIAGIAVLQEFVDVSGLACELHNASFSLRVLKVVCNCFFAGQAKRSIEKVTEDTVAALKKSKRQKL